MHESNRIIQSLWVGRLSAMERTCIRSHQAHGHDFHLYTYGELEGVPEGAIVKDANEIVPQSEIEKFQNLSNFSDYFRFTLLFKNGGWWTDMDSVCLKPFDFPEEYVIPNEEADNISAGVFKVPAGSPIMAWCVEEQKKMNWKTCRWSDLGPYLMFKAVHRFGLRQFIHKQETFIPVHPFDDPVKVFTNPLPRSFGEGTYAVHLFNEMWRGIKADKDASYPPSCLYERFKRRYLNSPPELVDPKVSIVIPCYNYGRFLGQAIESALGQTYENIEVIVVDDGSTDDSVAVAESYGDKIKLVRQRHSGAPATGRNTGVANSTGELVLPLDADDWLENSYLEKTVPRMTGNVGVVGVHIVGAGSGWQAVQAVQLKDLVKGNQVANTSLIRRQALDDAGGWYSGLQWQGYEDWNLWISIMAAGWEIDVIAEGLYNYRQHGPSLISTAAAHNAELVSEIRALHAGLHT